MLESKSQHPQPPLLLLSLRDPRTRNRPSFLDLSIYMEYSPTVATCLRHFSASDVMCQGTNSCMVVGTKLRGGAFFFIFRSSDACDDGYNICIG
jgi:hypothetical protein